MRPSPALLLLFFAALLPAACSAPLAAPGDLPDAGPRPDLSGPDPSAALFAPDHVVEVDIRLAPGDWDTMRTQDRTLADIFTNCLKGPFADPFTYFPGTVTIDGQMVSDVGVRKKGFLGSLDDDKPSLKLKFDQYVDGQRLAGLKSFTLNNSRQDPSLIHQCLAYRTFAAAGVPASRCNFAHVRVNGADLGIYVHVESGSKELLARHYLDPGGNLYEGTLSDFRDGWTATFELKTNEAQNDRADLAPVVAALKAADDELLARLDPVLDVDRFLTFWATEVVIGHWDGYTGDANNFYAYHNPMTGKFEFIPWGPDATFAPRVFPDWNGRESVMATSLLPRRLYLYPPTRDRYLTRLREVLAHAWDEAALNAEIDRMQKLLGPLVDPQGNRGFAAQVAAVRNFVAARRGQIESELAGGPPSWTAPLRDAPCYIRIGTISGSMQTTWGTVGMANPVQIGTGTLAGMINGMPFDVVRAGAVAGVDPKATPPAPAQIAVVAQLRDGSAEIAGFSLPVNRFVSGSTAGIDFWTVNGGVSRYNPSSQKVEPVGILIEGVLHLDQAGTTPGAPVKATFSGTVVRQP